MGAVVCGEVGVEDPPVLEGAGGPCGGGVGGGVAVAVDGEFGAEFAAEPGELVDGGVGGDVDEALLPACDEFDGEVAFGAGEFGGEDGGGCVEVSEFDVTVGEGLAERFEDGVDGGGAGEAVGFVAADPGVCGEPGAFGSHAVAVVDGVVDGCGGCGDGDDVDGAA